MNYYDEEITISGPNTQQLSHIKVERLPSGRATSASARNSAMFSASSRGSRGSRVAARAGTKLKDSGNSLDDDGLLQDIIDHDDEANTDDDDDDDNSNIDMPSTSNANKLTLKQSSQQQRLNSGTQMRPQTQQQRWNAPQNPAPAKDPKAGRSLSQDSEPSDTESDEATALRQNITSSLAASEFVPPNNEPKFSITPDKWESLNIHQDIKDLFPYMLKYTTQSISIPYRLQAFIPDYVPAIGDVDAFLKVSAPPLLQQPGRQAEIDAHIAKLGLHILDEPAGEQSEPSLLTMKLRSVLTGSGVNPRSASAALIPTVKHAKDIDKWINEVEQVHIAQAPFDVPLRADIDFLHIDWPREFADAHQSVQDSYNRSMRDELPLDAYVRELSERFNVKGPLDTQADYLLNVHTLFALYLVANQAWE